MKNCVCYMMLFFTCKTGLCQNLVPNGDFESYVACPDNEGQLDSALFWINPTYASPDYFHTCSGSPFAGVPVHINGFQQPHSGSAYSGIYLWQNVLPNGREYIQTSLQSPLTANTCYYFEMFVNLSNGSKYTTDDIAVYFSDTLVKYDTIIFPFIPHINNANGNYFDTLSWTYVSGNYTAAGGERYLIIGNFKDDSLTDTVLVNVVSSNDRAYVYIDDVTLTLCTGVDDQNEMTSGKLFPNPFTNGLSIRINNDNVAEIILYDMFGRKQLGQLFTGNINLNTVALNKGIYLYTLSNEGAMVKYGIVVKN